MEKKISFQLFLAVVVMAAFAACSGQKADLVPNEESETVVPSAPVSDSEEILPSSPSNPVAPPSTISPQPSPTANAPEAVVDVPASPRSESLQPELKVKKVAGYLGLVEVEWRVPESAGEAILWGPFNRMSEVEGCGLAEDGRYLAVNPPDNAGTDITLGSRTSEIYQDYLTGNICDAEHCPGFDARANGAAKCRIDLHQTAGKFFTRMNQKHVDYVIAVRNADGTWATTKKSPGDAMTPSVETVFQPAEGDKLRLSLSYTYASPFNRPIVSGCREEGDTAKTSFEGTGSANFTCRIGKRGGEIMVVVPGIGGIENLKIRRFNVKLSDPEVGLEPFGTGHCDEGQEFHAFKNCAGTMSFDVTIARNFHLIDSDSGGEILSGPTKAGLESVTLYSLPTVNLLSKQVVETKSIDRSSESATVRFENVKRDHDHYRWWAMVSTGDEVRGSKLFEQGYDEAFDIENFRRVSRQCYVRDASPYHVTGQWFGAHVKEVEGTCEATHGRASVHTRQPDADDYGPAPGQSGLVTIRGDWLVPERGAPENTVRCQLEATAYDGRKIRKTVRFNLTCPSNTIGS